MGKRKLETTAKQVAANRRNAQKSTGPITPLGKTKASRNALKHGLLASDVVLGEESAEEFERFRDAMAERRAPEGELEIMLAQRIVAAAWRLRRAGRIEQEMLQAVMTIAYNDRQDPLQFLETRRSPEAKPVPLTLGSVLTEESWTWDRLNNLTRYEGHLERIFYKGLHELQRLQAARNNHPVAAPCRC
ncbi:MAG: hypothetical protein JW741_30720 [Sedimentisphaerales bacterium]|nr:hypothetical protein [Sedimentisphaerales bacterium]